MSFFSGIKKSLYGSIVGLTACGRSSMNRVESIKDIHVYYGGARSGHRGGPQVKIDILKKIFPEYRKNFNMLYLLSGSLYMPEWAIRDLKTKNISVVLNQNGVFYPAWYPDKWQVENERMAKALSLADYVFYQSDFCKLCADKFLGVSAKNSEILYNGVDTSFFVPRRDGYQNKRFRFLLSGNIYESTFYRLKNSLDALILARKQGLDIEIYFAGILPDKLRSRFLIEIENSNMKEFFTLGQAYSRVDAPQVFSMADAYLITKHNDPCPNVVLEAMSCGLPVLYSASGGIPEMVGLDAGVGLSVPETFTDNPVPDCQAIVDGMSKIISNRQNYAIAARLRAQQKFDVSLWAQRHLEVFKKLRFQ